MIGSNGIHNDVEQRVDLYRNKPQELQQRYAMSQELIDLLALQKLTAEKKAVAQHMALQAGAGGKPPTIAQQREQEAMQLTKQEVTQQQAGLLQQQQAEKQKRMQEMVGGGLGSLPAPNVATPQAMAAGGIVDMDDDDEEGYAKGGAVDELPPWFEDLLAAIQQRESANDPNAVSPKGAEGLMQVMPGTQRDPGFGVRPAASRDPEELRRVGRDYAAAMYKRYGGDVDKMLAAYNWGPGNVDKFGTDPSRMPAETRKYIPAVRAEFERRAGPNGIMQLAQANTGTMNDASPERSRSSVDASAVDGSAVDAARERLKEAERRFKTFGSRSRRNDPEGYAAAKQEYDAATQAEKTAMEQYQAQLREQAPGIFGPITEPLTRRNTVRMPAPPGGVPQSRQMSPNAETDVALPTPIPRIDVDGVGGTPPPAPKDEAGLAALVAGAKPQGSGLSQQDDEFRQAMKEQIMGQVKRDPLAEADAEQQRALAALAMSPEQLAARQRTLEGIAGIDTRRFDPERMRREELQRFLIGMGGRSSIGSVAQGATAASINYRNEMDALERAALGQRSALEDKFFEDERGIRKDAFGARGDVRKEAEAGIRQGTASGSAMSNSDLVAVTQAEVAAATRQAARAQDDQTRFARLAEARTSVVRARESALGNVDRRFGKRLELLETLKVGGKMTPEQQKELTILSNSYDIARREVEDQFAEMERAVVSQMGGAAAGSGGGFKNFRQVTK